MGLTLLTLHQTSSGKHANKWNKEDNDHHSRSIAASCQDLQVSAIERRVGLCLVSSNTKSRMMHRISSISRHRIIFD